MLSEWILAAPIIVKSEPPKSFPRNGQGIITFPGIDVNAIARNDQVVQVTDYFEYLFGKCPISYN